MAIRRAGGVGPNMRLMVGGSAMTMDAMGASSRAKKKFHRDLQKKVAERFLTSRSSSRGYIAAGPP